MKGDKLESFHNTWNLVVSELSEPPDPKLLQYLYYEQIKNFKALQEDIAHYKRAKGLNGPEYCFDWLWQASTRYLTMKREDYMQDALSQGLNGATSDAALAPDPRGQT